MLSYIQSLKCLLWATSLVVVNFCTRQDSKSEEETPGSEKEGEHWKPEEMRKKKYWVCCVVPP